MQTIKEALATNPGDGTFVAVPIAPYVDLVDSIKGDGTTEVAKQQLAGARKAAETLRGQGGVCHPTAGLLRALLEMAPNPPVPNFEQPKQK